jgi:UDP-N-acetylmuramoyl-L-alanyl-D-glutamate--2,6-diaminopimelate ligase
MGGAFNVANALAALHAAVVLGVDEAAAVAGLASSPPVPGRFEPIDEGQAFDVVVDFAHTPDGLDVALRAARVATTNRVLVVFGCGGDKDRDKRPKMGQIAAQLADVVVVTSDNPRSEDPAAIIGDVLAGTTGATGDVRVDPDRRAAIALALDLARAGDLVLVAGKGHETTQTIGPTTIPFDDRVVVRELLAARP